MYILYSDEEKYIDGLMQERSNSIAKKNKNKKFI